MYKNILVPVAPDHAKSADEALAVARLLMADGGKITALTVVEEIPGYIAGQLPEGQMEKARGEAEAALAADFAGVPDVTPVVVDGHSARTILDYAKDRGADLIVIASHRPDISDYFLGSTAARVVRHAQCAVHVLR